MSLKQASCEGVHGGKGTCMGLAFGGTCGLLREELQEPFPEACHTASRLVWFQSQDVEGGRPTLIHDTPILQLSYRPPLGTG